jgi:hypothetical protein
MAPMRAGITTSVFITRSFGATTTEKSRFSIYARHRAGANNSIYKSSESPTVNADRRENTDRSPAGSIA